MKIIEKRENGSIRVHTKNELPSMTDQSFKKECDVNVIIDKYLKTGQLPNNVKHNGQYLDTSEIKDQHEGLSQIRRAGQAFQDLPDHIKAQFPSPEALIEFLSDERNNEMAIRLGLKSGKLPSDKQSVVSKKDVSDGKKSESKDSGDSKKSS
jgi:hypothetical protein